MAVLPVELEDVVRGEASGSLQAVDDFLRGEGRQLAYEEVAVLPVERVGAAAAVDCSCCRTCDVINTSPPTRDKKKIKKRRSNKTAEQ